ncbi:MAG: hypothetical protein IPK65_03025 [Gammaproteobacteria bacterium]|nr:hypothetical protein [Gammaproteobacteria bacterium]
MKKSAYAVLVTGLLGAGSAMAHVGIFNNTLPLSASGQTTFGVANGTSDIQFLVPHGCNDEAVPAVDPAMDTTRLEITVPAAIVTATGAGSVRPSNAGEFGDVSRTANGDGSITFTWNKVAGIAAADDQLYKVSIRMRMPAVASADDFAIKKYQFPAVQTCNDGVSSGDIVLDWGSGSPTIIAFPEKRKGFNQYTLDASTVGDFATAPIAARLKAYFGDAAIVWVGKKGYSPNATTSDKIDELVTEDLTYSNLGTDTGTTLTESDTIWVKY